MKCSATVRARFSILLPSQLGGRAALCMDMRIVGLGTHHRRRIPQCSSESLCFEQRFFPQLFDRLAMIEFDPVRREARALHLTR